ncbi:hypothetical protein F4859DRAFT_492394 [Xylaria cf. heliscus]|nr:hypothetical protein F4859DRAFT_492394 [Xylaria cf. heliscus]
MSHPFRLPLQRALTSCRGANLYRLQHLAGFTPCATARSSTIIQPSKRYNSTLLEGSWLHNLASDAASTLTRFMGDTAVRFEVATAERLRNLSIALGRRNIYRGANVESEMILPPGYHLLCFTPKYAEDELSAGSAEVLRGRSTFTKRIWTGGRMMWPDEGFRLKVDDRITERTKILSATPSRNRAGVWVVDVQVQKEYLVNEELAVVDHRSWAYHVAPPASVPRSDETYMIIKDVDRHGEISANGRRANTTALPERHIHWSPTGLFDFSALTSTDRKTYQDPTWSTAVEGLIPVSVNLIHMLDYWRDCCSVHKHQGYRIQELKYETISPMYAADTYQIGASFGKKSAEEVGRLRWDIRFVNAGRAYMTGEIFGYESYETD